MSWRVLVLVCVVFGCEKVAEPDAVAPRVFGEIRDVGGGVTSLEKIAADPDRYDGDEVLTEGTIERVCQRRGCWLELADSSGARAFVPMANHAFSVPTESIGKRALVEGTVFRRQRSEAERKHLESDGAGSQIPNLSIEARGVLIP